VKQDDETEVGPKLLSVDTDDARRRSLVLRASRFTTDRLAEAVLAAVNVASTPPTPTARANMVRDSNGFTPRGSSERYA
jgi:hypothetical protein